MADTDLRKRIKRRIDALSADRLAVADDFLAYLQERESEAATAELLRIPGIRDELKKAEEEVAAGRVSAWKKKQRKRSA
jgi:hypothetical protein